MRLPLPTLQDDTVILAIRHPPPTISHPMNHEPAFLDSLSAAKTRVLAIHGTNYLQAILPEIVALARYAYVSCEPWPQAYKERWDDIVEYLGDPRETMITPENVNEHFDRLAAAYFEILSHPELTQEG